MKTKPQVPVRKHQLSFEEHFSKHAHVDIAPPSKLISLFSEGNTQDRFLGCFLNWRIMRKLWYSRTFESLHIFGIERHLQPQTEAPTNYSVIYNGRYILSLY